MSLLCTYAPGNACHCHQDLCSGAPQAGPIAEGSLNSKWSTQFKAGTQSIFSHLRAVIMAIAAVGFVGLKRRPARCTIWGAIAGCGERGKPDARPSSHKMATLQVSQVAGTINRPGSNPQRKFEKLRKKKKNLQATGDLWGGIFFFFFQLLMQDTLSGHMHGCDPKEP